MGRISTNCTSSPASATCQAASVPARPAPITTTDGAAKWIGAMDLNPIDPSGRVGSGPTALDHQLQLANSGTADVETGPAQGKQDG